MLFSAFILTYLLSVFRYRTSNRLDTNTIGLLDTLLKTFNSRSPTSCLLFFVVKGRLFMLKVNKLII